LVPSFVGFFLECSLPPCQIETEAQRDPAQHSSS
jgi:hypothetical protein